MYGGPNPDKDWYLRISTKRHVTPRCPFASLERCPRYYVSRSLLGEAGSTKIPQEEDYRLLALWEKSDLWPRTKEEDTGMSENNERNISFSNFCPEIIYERFNVFASGLQERVDEIDREYAYERLSRDGIPASDWRWRWWDITPMHFTECPLYSLLTHGNGLPAADYDEKGHRVAEIVTPKHGTRPDPRVKCNEMIAGLEKALETDLLVEGQRVDLKQAHSAMLKALGHEEPPGGMGIDTFARHCRDWLKDKGVYP